MFAVVAGTRTVTDLRTRREGELAPESMALRPAAADSAALEMSSALRDKKPRPLLEVMRKASPPAKCSSLPLISVVVASELRVVTLALI